MELPNNIEDTFKNITGKSEAEIVVRGLTDRDGNLGDLYLVYDADVLHILSRSVGKRDYAHEQSTTSDIGGIELKEDSPFYFLDMTINGEALHLKFSILDLDTLHKLIDVLYEAQGKSEAPAHDSVETEEQIHEYVEAIDLNEKPLVGFCAIIQALVRCDLEVEASELQHMEIILDDEKAWGDGLALWRTLGTTALIEKLNAAMDGNQKLCILANVVDVAMTDGKFCSSEQLLVKQIRQGFGISDENYDAIFKVLMIKHNIGVFQ